MKKKRRGELVTFNLPVINWRGRKGGEGAAGREMWGGKKIAIDCGETRRRKIFYFFYQTGVEGEKKKSSRGGTKEKEKRLIASHALDSRQHEERQFLLRRREKKEGEGNKLGKKTEKGGQFHVSCGGKELCIALPSR